MNNKIPISKIPVIETERLILRELSLDDVDDIFGYASIPEVSTFLLWYPHKSKQDSIDFINFAKDMFAKDISIIWGIELKEEKKLIGIFDLRTMQLINDCAEIGYVISNIYWNRGFISESIQEVIKFCFNELKLNRVEAHCDEENIGSARVMEKAGMKYEGTMREKLYVKDKYRSMKLYSILKSEFIQQN
jgi:ribosomal-protein-alanine N-acetyltransferase